jgi:hypothetical protein
MTGKASLEPVLSSIEERLGKQGPLSFDLYVHDADTKQDWTEKRKVEVSHAQIDRVSCGFKMHWNAMVNDNAAQDVDVTVPIAQIEGIQVMTLEQNVKVVDAKEGHAARSYRTDPPVYSLMLYRSNASNVFNFYDPDAADRAATLMAQAVQLCGGAPPSVALHASQPFNRLSEQLRSAPSAAAQNAAAPNLAAPAAAALDASTIWVPAQGRRVALVIGNSAYGQVAGQNIWPDLQGGPRHDADAVAARLRQLGFTVTETLDRNLDQLNSDLRQFAGSLTHDTLALFYYSGHGTRAPRANDENGDDNYIVPVNTNLMYDYDAESKAVSLTKIRNLAGRARAAVVILDACRNDSLRRPQARDAGTRGFAGAEIVTGMLFAYSTAAGDVANNRPGQMSPYTEALVARLGRRGETLTTTFRSVRLQLSSSGNSRLPELADALNQDIVLVP